MPRTSLTPEQIDQINQMAQRWTDDYSHNRAIEELLELSLSLLHLSRNKIERSEVKKEMADVRLALEHLECKFGNYQEELNSKLERTVERELKD